MGEIIKMSKWRSQSITILLVLIFACILLFAFSFVNPVSFTASEVVDYYEIEVGETITNDGSILHTNNSMNVPILFKPAFIVHLVKELNFKGLLLSFTTGTVDFDFTTISAGGIDGSGRSTTSTPGFVQSENGKLVIKEINSTIYGKSYNYKYLVKTEEGFDLYLKNTKIKSIPAADVRSTDFGEDINSSQVAEFYNSADNKIGSIFPLEFGLKDINDGRNSLTPQEIKECFNTSIRSYAAHYPQGDPVVIYMPPYTEVTCAEHTTTLGDHSEYGNSLREYNAINFCKAWNNTIIPDNSSSSGKADFGFQVAQDASSPGGGAAHGVCPSARALRNALLDEGFPIPTGITMDENCVSYGFHPTTDIIVTNNGPVPIKIVMWTTGSGIGMVIHCKIIKLVPNDKLDQYDLTNSTKKVASTEDSV